MSTPDLSGQAPETSRLQKWFQSVVTHPNGIKAGADSDAAQKLISLSPDEMEKVITRSRALTAGERLAIYANAYHTRLLECLGEVFPTLKRTLGGEAFDGLAFGYLQEYPSRSYTLNDLGRDFARFLEETKPAADEENHTGESRAGGGERMETGDDWPDFMIDLARLEWAIYEVFDGEGVEGKELPQTGQLLAIARDKWPEVRFKTVPCLRLLTTRFPVNDFFTTMRRLGDNEVADLPPAMRSYVAITRRNYVVRRYNLSETEFELLRTLQTGERLGRAVERAATVTDENVEELPAKLERWFRNWTAEGFFQSIHLVD